MPVVPECHSLLAGPESWETQGIGGTGPDGTDIETLAHASFEKEMFPVTSAAAYPVRVEASLDSPLSRWLWLVKWLLAVPHYIVLAFLWIAFTLLSIVALFAILFTGRYPRSIFDFNVGVLRWSWRVAYYAYGALGTDKYPPFTLRELPDDPARLDIAYPQRLSRGLVLVKWWLLAIPQYIVIGFFLGGGGWIASRYGDQSWGFSGGLIGVLVLVAAVVLLFTGRYPHPLFDFILGLDRWVLRVVAYAGLMTDRYPPFRLDMGGAEPGSTLAMSSDGPVGGPPPGPSRRGWTGVRIVSVVVGSVLALISAGLLLTGGAGLWADRTQREDGFLTTSSSTLRSDGYAITTDTIDLNLNGPTSGVEANSLLGTVRIRAGSTDPTRPVFLGIASEAAARKYLAGVHYATVSDFTGGTTKYVQHVGAVRPIPPRAARIWSAAATGPGTQTLRWRPDNGSWMVVAMNADASPGVDVRANVGATVPALRWIAIGLLIGGAVLLIVGVVLIAVPVSRATRFGARNRA